MSDRKAYPPGFLEPVLSVSQTEDGPAQFVLYQFVRWDTCGTMSGPTCTCKAFLYLDGMCLTCGRVWPTPVTLEAWHAGIWPSEILWWPDVTAQEIEFMDHLNRWRGYFFWGCADV